MPESLLLEVSWYSSKLWVLEVDEATFHLSSEAMASPIAECIGEFPNQGASWYPRITESKETTEPEEVKLEIVFTSDFGTPRVKSGILRIMGDHTFQKYGDLNLSVTRKN